MAILMNPATGDNEPVDLYDEGDPFDYLWCPECQHAHRCDDDGIYSDCDWAQDQMDMSPQMVGATVAHEQIADLLVARVCQLLAEVNALAGQLRAIRRIA